LHQSALTRQDVAPTSTMTPITEVAPTTDVASSIEAAHSVEVALTRQNRRVGCAASDSRLCAKGSRVTLRPVLIARTLAIQSPPWLRPSGRLDSTLPAANKRRRSSRIRFKWFVDEVGPLLQILAVILTTLPSNGALGSQATGPSAHLWLASTTRWFPSRLPRWAPNSCCPTASPAPFSAP